MIRTLPNLDTTMRWVAHGLGGAVLVLAGASLLTEKDPASLIEFAGRVFGPGFITAYVLLLFAGLVCWRKQARFPGKLIWYRAGLHAASGIATLALTFTLLGISLGIGGLAEQRLSPDTIGDVIAALTAQFSMAFMTTVVGLPTAALLRALVSLTDARRRDEELEGDNS